MVIVGPQLDHDVSVEVLSRCASSGALSNNPLYYIDTVSHATILAMVQEADIVTNSSKSEGMANALLEAMALETVVIARDIPGNRAILRHGENGLLFTTPLQFCECADKVLSHPDLRSSLVASAKAFVEQALSARVEADGYSRLLKGLLSSQPSESHPGAPHAAACTHLGAH